VRKANTSQPQGQRRAVRILSRLEVPEEEVYGIFLVQPDVVQRVGRQSNVPRERLHAGGGLTYSRLGPSALQVADPKTIPLCTISGRRRRAKMALLSCPLAEADTGPARKPPRSRIASRVAPLRLEWHVS
jgi:hypothetical protein